MARSSRAIWEGPSSPMETPAWLPATFTLVYEIKIVLYVTPSKTKVKQNIHLRDDSHPEVVKGPGEEAGKRGDKGDGAIATGETDANLKWRVILSTIYHGSKDISSHPGHVLLADEALDVPLRKLAPDPLGEGGVLHVPVQGDHARVALGDLQESAAVRLPEQGKQGDLDLISSWIKREAAKFVTHLVARLSPTL